MPLLPGLSYWFHLTPSDVYLLCDDELELYVDALGEINGGG